MQDTYYRDPMELFNFNENKDLYLKSFSNHSHSYVFKFDNNYGAHIVCEPLSTFTVNPLIFSTDYIFDTAVLNRDSQDPTIIIAAKSGLSFNHMIDILQKIKNLPMYVKPAPETELHAQNAKRNNRSKNFYITLNSELTKRKNKEAINKCQK